jgi:hypothetical protein
MRAHVLDAYHDLARDAMPLPSAAPLRSVGPERRKRAPPRTPPSPPHEPLDYARRCIGDAAPHGAGKPVARMKFRAAPQLRRSSVALRSTRVAAGCADARRRARAKRQSGTHARRSRRLACERMRPLRLLGSSGRRRRLVAFVRNVLNLEITVGVSGVSNSQPAQLGAHMVELTPQQIGLVAQGGVLAFQPRLARCRRLARAVRTQIALQCPLPLVVQRAHLACKVEHLTAQAGDHLTAAQRRLRPPGVHKWYSQCSTTRA